MINDKFIHIHIPRTGGQLLRSIIFNKKSKFQFLVRNSHMTLKESLKVLEQKSPGTKVSTFCVVRNPWDWYVSRYFFRQKEKNKNQIIEIEMQGADIEGFRKHLYILKDYIDNRTKISSKKGGVPRIWQRLTVSQFYNEMTEGKINHIAKIENYANEMADILNKIDPDTFTIDDVKCSLSEKYNYSVHDQYRKYYTDELREIVNRWDSDYIKQFNYKF